MSYDLAVWVGERPSSDKAAAAEYERVMARFEAESTSPAPSPEIQAYVDALLSRWPDITDDSGDESPWADGPMIGNASGSAIYFSMVWSRCEEASAFAAETAEQHRLVCFDPQQEQLRPAVPSSRVRRWFKRRD